MREILKKDKGKEDSNNNCRLRAAGLQGSRNEGGRYGGKNQHSIGTRVLINFNLVKKIS